MGIDSVVSGVVWDSLEARVGWALVRKGELETLIRPFLFKYERFWGDGHGLAAILGGSKDEF